MPEPPSADNFRDWFAKVKSPPAGAGVTWYQTRGLHFERALYWLLDAEGLSPRTSFRPKSEQVDGAFECDYRHFLLEAKWRRRPVGIKELDAFQAKVERRLSGTLGVFISMSGYPRSAADTLVRGRSLKVILFSERDMDASFDVAIGFRRVLATKIRAAAEFGVPYREYLPVVVTTGETLNPAGSPGPK